MFTFGSKSNDTIIPLSASIQEDKTDNINLNTILSFIACFSGLQVSFVLWGLMQERIIKYGYTSSDSKEFSRFKNSQFLVLSNRLAGLILSSIILVIFDRKSFKFNNTLQKIVSAKNWAPLFICSYSSLSNVLSSWCQYEALKYN